MDYNVSDVKPITPGILLTTTAAAGEGEGSNATLIKVIKPEPDIKIFTSEPEINIFQSVPIALSSHVETPSLLGLPPTAATATTTYSTTPTAAVAQETGISAESPDSDHIDVETPASPSPDALVILEPSEMSREDGRPDSTGSEVAVEVVVDDRTDDDDDL